MQIKLALPKGRFMQDLAALFLLLGLKLNGYDSSSRCYRPSDSSRPELFIKVFQEKDIPVQVAVGNYDLGICGSDWIEELLARYSSAGIVKIKNMGLLKGYVYAATSTNNPDLKSFRLASEYPNITASYALKKHMGKFNVFPLWGSSEVYPPENADMVILPVYNEQNLQSMELETCERISPIEALLIANSYSWSEKDLSPFLKIISDNGFMNRESRQPDAKGEKPCSPVSSSETLSLKGSLQRPIFSGPDILRLALPDGHQLKGTRSLLEKAGLRVAGYHEPLLSRRLAFPLEGIAVKVIRPQDMPAQVALGNFDLAITGQDWLMEHLTAFPSSPVKEVIKLGVGKVRIVAAADGNLMNKGFSSPEALLNRSEYPCLRVASEYINIAESYTRERHLNPCKVIPTWGASESFLPEDADLLIENIETGKTLQEHGLAVMDVLFESQACVIGSKKPMPPHKATRAEELIERLKKVCEK